MKIQIYKIEQKHTKHTTIYTMIKKMEPFILSLGDTWSNWSSSRLGQSSANKGRKACGTHEACGWVIPRPKKVNENIST